MGSEMCIRDRGLTLPFISSGGSSLIVCMALTAICLRISQEVQTTAQRPSKKSRVAKPRKAKTVKGFGNGVAA